MLILMFSRLLVAALGLLVLRVRRIARLVRRDLEAEEDEHAEQEGRFSMR